MKNRPLVSAALLGLGGGLRSFAPPAALALRVRGPLAGPARFIAFGAAAGELIADKQPQMSSRLALRGLALRLGFSSSGGATWAAGREQVSLRSQRWSRRSPARGCGSKFTAGRLSWRWQSRRMRSAMDSSLPRSAGD